MGEEYGIGVSAESVRQNSYVLRIHDHELARVYEDAVTSVKELAINVAIEMKSAKHDLAYWNGIFESPSSWIIFFTRLNNGLYRRFRNLKRSLYNKLFNFNKEIDSSHYYSHSELKKYENIDNFSSILRSNVNGLACLLSDIHDATSFLFEINRQINGATIDRHNDESISNSLNRNEIRQLNAMARDNIRKCLRSIKKAILNYSHNYKVSQHGLLLSKDSGIIFDDEERENTTSQLNAIFIRTKSLIISFTSDATSKEYPLSIVQLEVRRPSLWERYWFRNTLLVIASTIIGRKVFIMSKDGSLQRHFNFVFDLVRFAIQEHVIDPVSELVHKLFETIQDKDKIVSAEDLEQSRESLKKMLDDFSKSSKGIQLMHYLSERLSKLPIPMPLKTGDKTITSTTVTDTDTTTAESGGQHTGATTDVTPVGSGLEGTVGTLRSNPLTETPTVTVFSTDEAMKALMSTYEIELQNPIVNLLFGNLMTAMLIQMQKLKVHTEAAMLKMDKVLASNQLTMAATAAIPGLAIVAGMFHLFRRLFFRTQDVSVESNLKLRLIFTDVERCFQTLYYDSINADNEQFSPALALSPPLPHPTPSPAHISLSRPPNIDTHIEESYVQDKYSDHPLTVATPTKASAIQYPNFVNGQKNIMVTKGMLHYNLYLFRNELMRYFKQQSNISASTSGSSTKHASSHPSAFLAVALSSIMGQGEYHPVVSELNNILKDLQELEGSEVFIPMNKKLSTTFRMRNSYRCLIPNL